MRFFLSSPSCLSLHPLAYYDSLAAWLHPHYYTCTVCWLAERILALLPSRGAEATVTSGGWTQRQGTSFICFHNYVSTVYTLQFFPCKSVPQGELQYAPPLVGHLSGEPGNKYCGKCSVLPVLTFNFRPSQSWICSLHTIKWHLTARL